jgi:ABC-type transport system involved in cytochrome bd biosynthesis fused ATPase/permease subunit
LEGINKKIGILKKVVILAFSKYKILYLLSVISIVSIIIETLAMSLLSSISTRNYIIFDNILKNLDPLIVFNIALLLFLARFVTMSFIESRYVYVARLFQHYLSETTFNKILNEKLREIEKQEIGYFISMSGDEASKCSEILNSFLRALNTITIGIFYFIMVLHYDIKFLYILVIFFLVNYFFMRKSMKKLYKLGNESLILSRNSGSVLLDAFNSGNINSSQTINTVKIRVDFGKVIGNYKNPETGQLVPTTKGIIHNGKNGAHIVPSSPN